MVSPGTFVSTGTGVSTGASVSAGVGAGVCSDTTVCAQPDANRITAKKSTVNFFIFITPTIVTAVARRFYLLYYIMVLQNNG
jgi:hypothetical protein